MDRTAGATIASVHRTLAAVAVLVLSLVAGLAALGPVASSTTVHSLVVLAALSAAAAVAGLPCLLSVTSAGRRSLRPPRRASDVPLVLAGRTTDVVHHPVRPRAPGLV